MQKTHRISRKELARRHNARDDVGRIGIAAPMRPPSAGCGDARGASPITTDSALRTEIEALVARATDAQAAGDWHEALRCWREGGARFPELPIFRATELAMLQILERVEEADGLAAEGVVKFPDSIDVAAQWLNIAVVRQDWPEAAARAAVLADRFAEEVYSRHALPDVRRRIAAELARLDDAALHDSATHADATGRWSAAVEAWDTLRARGPGGSGVWIRLSLAQRRLGRFDDADRTLAEALRNFPTDAEVAAHHAEVAAERRDFTEAARRWSDVLSAFPDRDEFWLMAAECFRNAKFFARAGALIERAIEREPNRIEARVHHAVLAEAQEHWADAVARWDVAHRMAPDNPNIRNSRGDAIWQDSATRLESGATGDDARGHPDGIAAPAAPAPDGSARHEDADKHLALRFEGLGDHCEFGIVQRRLGAEPIGLFRFAAISAATLTALLAERLGRLGDPVFTELGLTDNNEYLVRDTRGLYHMHSFVRRGSVDEATFLRQQTIRLGFLKTKLIEDLEVGQKVFVHKSSLSRISDQAACALHDAIQGYGANILLVIRAKEPGHPAGTVHVLRDRLLVGHVDKPYSDQTMDVDFESWRDVLVAADRYRHSVHAIAD